MTSLENIQAQIEAFEGSARQIKSQYIGVSQLGFEIEGVSIEDFNTLVKKYKGKIVMSNNRSFFLIHSSNHDYCVAVWSVPCEALHPLEIKELQTA